MDKTLENTKIKYDISQMPPLNLAYIGDAVFELQVRTKIMSATKSGVGILHKQSSKIARAKAQSLMYHKLVDILSEEELAVLKRGRNAKNSHKAKNASVTEYRHATGVEALFGYLYLKGENERLTELFNICTAD